MIEVVWDTPGALLMIIFVAFFVGYAIGRRQGKREGFTEGVRFSPLEMRRQTWEQGHCVICGSESGGDRRGCAPDRKESADSLGTEALS